MADLIEHNGTEAPRLYGLMAEFTTPERLRAAARQAYGEGYREMDAYSPFPVEGLPEAVGFTKNRVPLTVLLGGIVGGSFAYFMMYFATVVDYPINVGGRPLHSWPAYVPIIFELTVLIASFAAFFGVLILNGLPQPYHPSFNAPNFERASRDRFFLCIEAGDPHFDRDATYRFLQDLQPTSISEVEP